jgi:hypothetical protein
MSNAVITISGGGYQITGSQRVHVYLLADLSGGPGAEAEFSVAFPVASAPTINLVHAGVTQQIFFGSPDPSPVFPNRVVFLAHADAAGIRTVTFSLGDPASVDLSTSDPWTLKFTGLAPADIVTATPGAHMIGFTVEADPFVDCTPLPATAFAGATISLSARARRNTMPLPTAASYNPPAPVLAWAQTGVVPPTAPITAGTFAVAPFAFVGPAADGFQATAEVQIPALSATAALQYTFTATFGEFTASCSGTVQGQPLSYRWLIALDRSSTMGVGTGTKWTNAKTVANLWADLVIAFRRSPASTDVIGALTFHDPSTGFRGSGVSAEIKMRWPGAAMAALPAVSDGSMDGFKVGGADVLGTPALHTPLGDGVVTSLDTMASGSPAGSNYHLLVVSDGLENAGTVIVDPSSSITHALVHDTLSDELALRPNLRLSGLNTNTHIYPVGTTTPTPANTTPLNMLGALGHGPFLMGTGVGDIFSTAYGSALFQVLSASQVTMSLGVIDNTNFHDPLPVGAGKQVYFVVPAGDDKLAVAVLCDNTARDRTLRLTWRQQMAAAPFLPVPGAAITSVGRDQYVFAVVDLTQVSAAATEWRVALDGPAASHLAVAVTDVLAGRDLLVRSTITFDKDAYFNDEPMVVRASVFAGITPVTDAQITVELEGPAVSEGELLAANAKIAAPPPPTSRAAAAGAEGQAPGSREAVLARVLTAQKWKTLPTVQYSAVFIDGSTRLWPDESGAGYYANIFTKNWREGRYDFRFTIRGRTADGGAFSDVYRTTRLVRVRVDDAASPVTVHGHTTRAPEGLRAARVTVRPADFMGQRLGPFHDDDVDFLTSSGAFVGDMESQFDGSYTRALLYPASHRPVVTVQVQGRTFTPVIVSHDLVGTITGLVRRALAWLVRFARRG